MHTTHKAKPSILANSILKEKFLNELIKKYDINKKIIEENPTFFETYLKMKYELTLYSSIIPYEKLDYYRGLKREETNFFIHLHKLLNEKLN